MRYPLPSLAAILFLAVSALTAKPVKFDIPAQPAADALLAFSKQSGADVLYSQKELSAVRSHAVTGEHEPDAAIAQLLRDTGFIVTRDAGKFVVAAARAAAGSVSGTLIPSRGGGALAGVTVTVLETGARSSVTERGNFRFPELPPGTYTLGVSGEGFSRLRITDVVVRAGIDTTLDTQELPALRRGESEVQTMKEVIVSAKNDVETLATVEVSANKLKPFTGANVDIPRTIDDAQPYYIFTGQTIERSGATNLENFFRQRLTMNNQPLPGSETGQSSLGTASSNIQLRGLVSGNTHTLILINGRRTVGVPRGTGNIDTQPDVNGIPLSQIDRIEVLPSSAAAIYGGGAVGGVINIILKRDYAGGEVKTTYQTPDDTDAATRTIALSYGMTLEGGRTHLTLSSSYSTATAMLLQDRLQLADRGIATISRNNPAQLLSPTSPFVGATPNIGSSTGVNLVLKPAFGGTALNSPITFIPSGYTATSSPALLVANAGRYNLNRPDTPQVSSGLRQTVLSTPTIKNLRASVRREMTSRLELFADFSYSDNYSWVQGSPLSGFTVASSVPTNPFQQSVAIRLPYQGTSVSSATSVSRSLTAGFLLKLPHDWKAEGDYNLGRDNLKQSGRLFQSTSANLDITSGVLNPFVDTASFPMNLDRYFGNQTVLGRGFLNDVALRLAGPLWRLPAGAPTIAIGLEHRVAGFRNGDSFSSFPNFPNNDFLSRNLGKSQTTNSAYVELQVPVISPTNRIPGVQLLDLQLSGRREEYSVTTGTSSIQLIPVPATPPVLVSGRADFDSTNPTFGLRYKPISGVMLRASYGKGFVPPTPGQLTNPTISPSLTSISDPRRGNTTYAVQVLSGGNPDLAPETSENTNAGIVLEPTFLKGLRFNVEYYKITKHNVISSLSAQNMVLSESTYPERVTRATPIAGDPFGVGAITVVNTSSLNLNMMTTSGFDVSVSYRYETTNLGSFDLSASATNIQHFKSQVAAAGPVLEFINSDGGSQGGGGPRNRANLSLTWERRRWTAGWTARYTGVYYVTFPQGTAASNAAAVLLQGSNHIPSQLYHDMFVNYRFGGSAGKGWGERLLKGMEVQLGVNNVFKTIPPFQATTSIFYMSTYGGNIRLRDISLSVKKAF